MVKKRPRKNQPRSQAGNQFRTKNEPEYWRSRLFRNSFTYRGDQHKVRHWSVKIQHHGTRKTFSLRAIDEKHAAAEACGIYKAILNHGWQSVLDNGAHKGVKPSRATRARGNSEHDGFKAQFWTQRLIHRKYTEMLQPDSERNFSARIEYAGTSYYFPLGTDHETNAARNAARIYRLVATQGWAIACKRFSRELSVTFRWSDNPLAWTYTTVFTHTESPFHNLRSHYQPGGQEPKKRRSQEVAPPALRVALSAHQATLRAAKPSARSDSFRVGIVEADPGLRQALCWSIDQQEGCSCVAAFASASEALEQIRKRSVHLLLVNQNLPDQPGIACLNELNAIAPKVYGLLFSVFEDSEQLFKAAPGGAPCYVFRRTAPTRILVPIEAALKNGARTREQFNTSVRRYFEDVVISSPIHGSVNELSNLTPREHEILGLLSKGHPDKEIADLLRISTWTVHGHLKKIFEKLGAHNRTDAVVKYLNK